MTYIIVAAALLVYICIGGFVCGLFRERDMMPFCIALWPLFVVIELCAWFVEKMYDLGKGFYGRWARFWDALAFKTRRKCDDWM